MELQNFSRSTSKRHNIFLPDFRLIFESAPALALILTPELRIAAASDSFLRAARHDREAVLGRGLDDVFPDVPSGLLQSLAKVLETHVLESMDLQTSAAWAAVIQSPGPTERYWMIANTPVFGAGEQVEFIIHRLEEVTGLVSTRELTTEVDGRHRLVKSRCQGAEPRAPLSAGDRRRP